MDLIEKYNKTNAFGKANNLVLEVIEPGEIEYTMQLRDEHFALPDVIHGGVLAGMMDALLSVSAFSAVAEAGKNVATIEFKINYLKAVRKKMELLGKGKVLNKGRRIIVTEGKIYNDENQIVATGIGSILPYDAKT